MSAGNQSYYPGFQGAQGPVGSQGIPGPAGWHDDLRSCGVNHVTVYFDPNVPCPACTLATHIGLLQKQQLELLAELDELKSNFRAQAAIAARMMAEEAQKLEAIR